jgi:multidrug efflux pump subunit AcrB
LGGTTVFLSLAALYESWSIPVPVILVVPLGVLGAVLAIFFVPLFFVATLRLFRVKPKPLD